MSPTISVNAAKMCGDLQRRNTATRTVTDLWNLVKSIFNDDRMNEVLVTQFHVLRHSVNHVILTAMIQWQMAILTN